MEETKTASALKVLMLPWLAHGHISPFLQLSKQLVLSDKNCLIYFCSTSINLKFVEKNLDGYQSIELVELRLPDSPELPPHYHTTKNLQPYLMPKLMKAFQSAKPSFSSIINTLSPDLLIYDSFQSWAPMLAAENNIPAVFFVTSGAATLSFYYHQFASRRLRCRDSFPFSSTIFLREYEMRKLAALVEANKLVSEDFAFGSFDVSSEIVLIKTCREIEEKYIDHLSFLCGKELVALGPLVQEPNDQKSNDHNSDSIIKFLDEKDPSSVVFISFGSEYFLSGEEREEIAKGLEKSNVNFIWVVRFPAGYDMEIEEAVPKGFLERVKNRGMVVDGWAPQARILGHSSTGGFVSHCGWSSVMESLYFGVPIIAMPMHLDQPTNAKLLGEIGVGMEVSRDEEGRINGEEFGNAVKMVVLEKDGERIRGKCRELRERLRLRGGEEQREAVEKLWSLCSKNKQSSGNSSDCKQQEQTQVTTAATVVG